MIELCHVFAGYDGKEVLHDINMQIKPGKITVMIGPNGSGKSTLLKSMVRIVPLSAGDIFIDHQSFTHFSTAELARKIAYCSQNRNIPELSVLKMVLHGRFAHLSYPRKYSDQDLSIAKKAIEWANLKEVQHEPVSKLSGGMQQKSYIAMALTQDANTILMDEPTTYLDIVHQLKTMEMARSLANEGKSVVMVLHDLSLALQIADEIAVLKEGCLLKMGSVEEVFESGCIQDAFHVQLQRVFINDKWHYFCELKGEE